MKAIFFWGGITTHTYGLVEAMSKYFKNIYAIVMPESLLRKERVANIPMNSTIKIEYCKQESDIRRIVLLEDKDSSIHTNASLKRGNLANIALKYLCKNNYHVMSFPQEAFQLEGLKGYVNYIKWFIYLHCTYRNKIDAFGLTGFNAEKQFKYLFINRQKTFQFLYVTKSYENEVYDANERVKFIFVGGIDKRKNIIPFVKWMMKYPNQNFDFEIYGSWTKDEVLRKLVENSTNIHYFGKKDYSFVRIAMAKADWLVLPSLHDGWGAVVNEGLQSGCKILVSKQSGASSIIIRNTSLGYVFDAHKFKELNGIIDLIMDKGPLSLPEKQSIVKWAQNHIGCDVIGVYLKDIIYHYYDMKEKPSTLWL